MNDSKPFYQSKTLWVNVLIALVVIVGLAAESPLFQAYAEELLFAQAVVNVLLRTVTNKPLRAGK